MAGMFEKEIIGVLAHRLTKPVKDGLVDAVSACLPQSAEDVSALVKSRLATVSRTVVSRELGLPACTVYRDVFEFVDHVVLDLYATEISNQNNWCSQWYAHKAAQRRLTLMWVTWEKARIEEPATGEESWMRTIGDHHMAFLMGSRGPFCACTRVSHRADNPLPSQPIPQQPSANEDHHDSESEE